MLNFLNKKVKLITVGFITYLSCFLSIAQESSGTIDLTVDSFKEFEVFSDSLDKYSVYFTGENHDYMEFNTQLEYKLLTFLNQTQGVKHFIFEQSPGLSYIVNKIVLEDETAHLLFLEDIFYNPFYKLVKKIRKYNDTLAPENKIQFHGIDIERFPGFSVYALSQIVDTLDYTIDGGEVFEQIKALASTDYIDKPPSHYYVDEDAAFQFGEVSLGSSITSILKGARKNETSLKLALGADSTAFYSIIESVEVAKEWYLTEQDGDVKSPIIRERFMGEEFLRVYAMHPDGKYYGQFGRCHLHKDPSDKHCYDYYMNSIANRINEANPQLENQVLVIPIFYTGKVSFDNDVIESLAFKERFTNSNESYIIDLAYKNGDVPISGFYDNLPFVIICNEKHDLLGFNKFDWDKSIYEVHFSLAAGYTFFNKLSKLNSVLEKNNLLPFDKQFIHYGASIDYFLIDGVGGSLSYIYYPEVSNGDRLSLKGSNLTFGYNVSLGNKYFLTAFGIDFGYGQMKLIETQITSVNPNLLQIDNLNKTVYKNDLFTIDPNVQMRLTLPAISLNIKAGYAFDVSGKYWKLDKKVKDFTKTSFTAPYVQIGASINVKM